MKIILPILLLFSTVAFGQQNVSTTLFWNSYTYYNPAMAGLQYKYHGAVHYRDQWGEAPGAPKTLLVNANTRINDKHGVGVTYMNEYIGISQFNNADINYNYQLKFKNDHRLSLGVTVGLINSRFDFSQWITPTQELDPSLPQGSTTTLNINTGVAYKAKNLLIQVGLTHLRRKYGKLNSDGTLGYQPAPHLHGGLEYKWTPFEKLSITPRVLASTDFVKYTISANTSIMYNDKCWIGASYHLDNTYGFLFGWDIKKKYRIGYSFEHDYNEHWYEPMNTHEFVFGVFLK